MSSGFFPIFFFIISHHFCDTVTWEWVIGCIPVTLRVNKNIEIHSLFDTVTDPTKIAYSIWSTSYPEDNNICWETFLLLSLPLPLFFSFFFLLFLLLLFLIFSLSPKNVIDRNKTCKFNIPEISNELSNMGG